jgi:hypothetical protein
MRIRITSVDHAPEELYEQTPFELDLLHEVPGNERRPYYWTAKAVIPLRWKRDGDDVIVTHIVLAARWQGTQIGAGMKSLPVNIAYVVDPAVLTAPVLDFKLCAYVAIGVADDVSE